MRIAVVGGTGLAGRYTVEAVRALDHVPVVIARSMGYDLVTGTGLDLVEGLRDVDAVIDTTNTSETDAEAARRFFGTVTRRLLNAEERVGVRHHVVLSIVGVDRVEQNGHYAGKRLQEQLVTDGPVPWTVQRTTQFFEFAEMVVGWTRQDGTAVVPPLRVQPVAVADVAEVLARTAAGPPLGMAPELAGPERQDLADMADRVMAARGEKVRVMHEWGGVFSGEMAGEALLPGPGAHLAPTGFDDWLADVAARP
jgi:uncharacterized protein YbjT (DUF2867 family)